MLSDLIIRNLQLKPQESRSFVVSCSGGVDSSVLLYLMAHLRSEFPIQLTVFHMNYQLRGKESDADEALVIRLCQGFSIPLHCFRVDKPFHETAIQEQARKLRLEYSKSIEKGAEWVEAHHADDQMETFLFRLMRGSGLSGLASMRMTSIREGRKVWRPFLNISKREIIRYAKENRVPYRQDRSNFSTRYDRNWIRLKVLPLLESRFPQVRRAMARTLTQIQEEEDWKQQQFKNIPVVLSEQPLLLDRECLKTLNDAELHRFLHQFFKERMKIHLSRDHIVGISELLKREDGFSYNAPKSWILRSDAKTGLKKIKIFVAESSTVN